MPNSDFGGGKNSMALGDDDGTKCIIRCIESIIDDEVAIGRPMLQFHFRLLHATGNDFIGIFSAALEPGV